MTHVTIRIPLPTWPGIRKATLYFLAVCAFIVPALLIGDAWPHLAVLAGWAAGIAFGNLGPKWFAP